MRAVVDAKEFSQALDKVSRALRKSACIPVLEEALVRFTGGRCILTGTDFETWLMTEIPAQGDDFAFVFHRTADAAKACRRFDGELHLELAESGEGRNKELRLLMRCGHRAGELHAFLPEEYPEPPTLEPKHSFTVNAASLLERINRIKYATVKPTEKTNVCCTSIHFSGNRIYCLDGLRAAWDTDESWAAPIPFMTPAAPLAHLKLFGNKDVSVLLDKRYVSITDGTLNLLFRRVEAVPFDLDSAIPRQFCEEVYVQPKEFMAELAYLKELAPSNQKYVIRFCNGRITTQVDECRYETEIHLDGKSEIEIGFNLCHMMDALQQFKGESHVRMKLTSPISPILLEAEGRSDHALVLPVRLKRMPAAA